MFKGHVTTGTVTGTAAAINVPLGFVPAVVVLINQTDPGMVIWSNSMPAAAALKLNDTPALSFITANGISAYEGSDTPGSEVGKGFTIGADSDLNAASDELHYIAFAASE